MIDSHKQIWLFILTWFGGLFCNFKPNFYCLQSAVAEELHKGVLLHYYLNQLRVNGIGLLISPISSYRLFLTFDL